jgi:hemerythrin-like domain-containing protein
MLDFLTPNPAVSLLKEDHVRIKELFDQVKKAPSRLEKVKIARAVLAELKAHTAVEEEIFYPAVRAAIGPDIMNEADEEHHVAKVLTAELDLMAGSESHFDAKFHVLTESVRHHINEEEGEMLPKAKGVAVDFEALAATMARRKETFLAEGVAPAGEDVMARAAGGNGDSSALAAYRTTPKLS